MLPKILVGNVEDHKEFFANEAINENFVLQIDGAVTNISELREWIVFCQNVLDKEGNYMVCIWNAGQLSAEAQSILLKPLEEKYEKTRFFLITERESDLLATIISRCEVIFLEVILKEEKYWKEVRLCWQKGPSQIIEFAEKFNFDELEGLFFEVANKLKRELALGVTLKRVKVLDKTLEMMRVMYKTNINKRMALESYLLSTWCLIKT